MAAKRAFARVFSAIAAAFAMVFCLGSSGCRVQNVYGPPYNSPDVDDINQYQDVYGPPPGEFDGDPEEGQNADGGSIDLTSTAE